MQKKKKKAQKKFELKSIKKNKKILTKRAHQGKKA